MADELLPYYEKELAFIRQMGAEFAKEHPKIAGRLGIHGDTIEDPHASRLVESFAYLNARIQHKLDDDFPELSDALLSVMFPHYQRPIPSMSIVQFVPDQDQLDGYYRVPKDTLIETEQFQGENCRFTSIYDVELWPLEITSASLIGRPFATPGSGSIRGAASVLKLSLKTFNEAISLSECAPNKLRFYLQGQPLYTYPLYQLLLNDCLGVYMADSEGDPQPVRLGSQAIRPVGFESEDGLLPYPANSFIGYRLLTEFFVFPEKFMFIDVDLQGKLPENASNRLDLYFYFRSTDIELEHNISSDSFALGCSPMVNLFAHKADPIKLDQKQLEYQIIPDSRRPTGYEIYSVDKVTASNSAGDSKEFLPFYGMNHKQDNSDDHAYWHAQRRPAKMGYLERDDGTDMHLTLVDLGFNPNIPLDRTLSINTTCSNRDLPGKMPFTLEHPKLQCVNGAPPCSRIRCVTQPSATVRPPLRNGARWRLISHLNLNALSISGQENSTEAFKEILRLYDFKETSVTRGLIESILSVRAKPISAPLNIDGHAAICRGMEIEVELDENLLTGSSSYLFATVLEHFFALYCPINSFTRTLIAVKGKEGYLKKCPPRSGEKILL